MRIALVILNPIAGAYARKDFASFLRVTLAREGIEADIHETRHRGDAESVTRERAKEFDLAIAAGGDGTVNEVASGMAATGVPLGIIPLGTANVLARELAIPCRVKEACRAIAGGRTRQMDVGVARFSADRVRRLFLCMAGAGFDATVADEYKRVRGGSSRYDHYVLPVLRGLWDFDFQAIRVTVDGKPLPKPATTVIAANTRSYGGPFTMAPDARVDDGLLHVCAVLARNHRDLLHCMWGATTGRHITYRDVLYVSGKRISMEAEGAVHFQVDGDAVGYLPTEVSIQPRALCVIAPPAGGTWVTG